MIRTLKQQVLKKLNNLFTATTQNKYEVNTVGLMGFPTSLGNNIREEMEI